MKRLENGVGKLSMDYRLIFTDHLIKERKFIEYVVPIIRMRSVYGD